MLTNEAIFKKFVSGDVKPLYEYVYPSLLLYAADHLTPNYSFLSEDCVQDAIMAAYKRRKAIYSFTSLKAFLYTCISNSAIGILRKHKSYSNFISDTITRHTNPDLSTEIYEQEVQRHIFNAIDSLPEQYRETFELSFEKGMSNAEVAAKLGISISSVKKRKTSIKLILQNEISQKFSTLASLFLAISYLL